MSEVSAFWFLGTHDTDKKLYAGNFNISSGSLKLDLVGQGCDNGYNCHWPQREENLNFGALVAVEVVVKLDLVDTSTSSDN